ncbi:hypothetical protein WSM22_03100 [Cytophagales bacterium WSM2-2]|nr:hypothetical protein WSM22_03100 [Cytophagales bacterium WSM2-2]
MSNQTQKIEVPEGYEIDSINKLSGEYTLIKQRTKDILEVIKTDDDVFADNGYTLQSFDEWCKGLRPHERAWRFIELLCKSLNGNWVPDFDNDNQYKYHPWFTGGSSGFRFDGYGLWLSGSHVGSRLCFKESRLAVHAGEKFTNWFKIAIVHNYE